MRYTRALTGPMHLVNEAVLHNVDSFNQFINLFCLFVCLFKVQSRIANYKAEKVAQVEVEVNMRTEEIRGIALMEDKMYVVCEDVPVIAVYKNIPPFKKCAGDYIELTHVNNPRDIVACEVNKCLFLSDWKIDRHGVIWRVDLDGPATKICECDYDIDIPVTLSCSDDRLLVTTGKLFAVFSILDTKLKLEHKVKFSDDGFHGIKADGDYFIVSYGLDENAKGQGAIHRYDNPPRIISKVGQNGHVSHSFDYVKANQESLKPVHLAVDSSYNVFVADRHGGRVLVFDSALENSSNLITTDRSCKPTRLYFHQSSGQLFVGMVGAPRIDIYEVSNENSSALSAV